MIAQLTLLKWEKCLETNVKSEQSYGVMEAIEVMRAMVIVIKAIVWAVVIPVMERVGSWSVK